MSTSKAPLPLKKSEVIDMYFMEHRAKLIDVAAFLDRIDRAGNDLNSDDFRMRAFIDALQLLTDGKPDRAKRILEHFSDPTTDPITKAPLKGALGAYKS